MTDYERQLQSALVIVMKMSIKQKEAFIRLAQLVTSKLPNLTAEEKAEISAVFRASDTDLDLARLRALIDKWGQS